MGLHGFVGYLPQPRATQDVDVMVPYSQKSKAVRAIAASWPRLAVHEFSQTIRFLDPGDVDPATGTPQPVIDLMLPWGLFPQTILENHVIVGPRNWPSHPHRRSGDRFQVRRSGVAASRSRQTRVRCGRLPATRQSQSSRTGPKLAAFVAAEVWEGGGQEVDAFSDLALNDEPFPI